MISTITIRVDKETGKMLEKILKKTGRKKSEFVRDAIKRQISIETFDQMRSGVLPFAEAQGLLTDEDIWKVVS